MGYSKVNVDDIEPAGPGGAVRFVRRDSVARRSGSTGSSSRRTRRGSSTTSRTRGQEEVNVIIRGSGVYRIDGEEVPVRVGTFFRFDPDTTRRPSAGPTG